MTDLVWICFASFDIQSKWNGHFEDSRIFIDSSSFKIKNVPFL